MAFTLPDCWLLYVRGDLTAMDGCDIVGIGACDCCMIGKHFSVAPLGSPSKSEQASRMRIRFCNHGISSYF